MDKETRLILAIFLSFCFMIIEVVGGYVSNSIAIYSDAAHLLTDIAGFGIALIATITARAPGSKHLTFGLARAEVFGALGSILSLWIITAFLLYAAFLRAYSWFEGKPETIDGFLMFLIACFGILVNICLGLVFSDEHGGAFHPAHSHDHGHESGEPSSHHGDEHAGADSTSDSTYQKVPAGPGESDVEMAHSHTAHSSSSNSSSSGGATLDHNHSHKSGSSHGSANAGERTHLLAGNSSAESTGYTASKSHDHGHSSHSHDRSHSHDHDHAADHCDDGHSHSHHSHAPAASNDFSIGNAKVAQSSHNHHHGHSHHHHGKDVNIEAAYLHVLTDLIQSIGVAIAGLLLWFYPHWQIIDPFCTLVFSVIALKSTIPLMQRVFMILFDGTPSNLDWEVVLNKFEELEGVDDVHDLHIWSISSSSVSLTCHIRSSNPQTTLFQAHNICRGLGIDHATIQVHDTCDERFCYSQTCDDDDLTGGAPAAKCHKGGGNSAASGGGAGADGEPSGGTLSRSNSRNLNKHCFAREKQSPE